MIGAAIYISGSTWPYACVVDGLHANFKTDGSEEETATEQPYQSVIQPTEAQSEREANQQWIAQYGLYNHLIGNGLLAEENALVAAFQTESEQSNIGKLQRAVAAFSQTGMGVLQQEAQNELTSIEPLNSVEQTLKEVLNILYSNSEDLRSMTEESTAELRQIAKRCPLDDGMGVYMARAALLSVDTLPEDYSNECERIPNLEEAKNKASSEQNGQVLGIYPNPTTGQLTVVAGIENDETGTVEVFNLLGQSVFSQSLMDGNKHEIDLSNMIGGIYNIRIIVNSKVEFSSKLSILN